MGEPTAAPPGRGERVALGVYFAAALTGLCVLSWNRAFGEDEVEHLFAAYTVGAGRLLYADIWQVHHPLLYWALAPLMFDEDPVLAYRLARGLMLMALLATLAAATACARRLGGWQAAVWTPALLLLETTVVNRGIEVRPDVPAALAVTLSFAAFVFGRGGLHEHLAQALLLSLGFLFSKKVAVLCVPFGLLWVTRSMRRRAPGLLLGPLALWMLPVLVGVVVLTARGNLDDYLRLNVRDVAELTARTAVSLEDPPTVAGIALREWLRNLFFLPAALVALVASIRVARAEPVLGFASLIGITGILGLFLNPFPWAYNYLPFFPVLAVLIGVWLARSAHWIGADVAPRRFLLAFAVVSALGMLGALPYLAQKADPTVRDHQLRVLQRIEAITEPDEAVWDRMGLHFQPSGHWMYVFNRHHLLRFQGGAAPYTELEGQLEANGVVVIISNPRIRQLRRQRPAFRAFLDQHFVHERGNLLVLGTAVDLRRNQTTRFDLLADSEMVYQGSGAIAVDGRRFLQGELARGPHTITGHAHRTRGKLIRVTPRPPPGTPKQGSPLFTNDGVPHVRNYLSRLFPQ